MPAPFAYSPGMLAYGFGPGHPWKPERLRRAVVLCEALVPGLVVSEPHGWDEDRLERIHTAEYLDVVRRASDGKASPAELNSHGIREGDTPRFDGMFEAAALVCAGSDWAARQVCDGAEVAVNLGGGLHHAQAGRASGFCVFNDCAVAIKRLQERFARIAYVDIDLHHGDGVQALFWDDPDVLTFSIHESGRYLYPGTGFTDEQGPHANKFNAPMEPHTTGDTWLMTLRECLLPAIDTFRPEALVLQMGCDAHMTDPLGHLMLTDREWLEGVRTVDGLGLPTVALGGGGYDLANVPRMWAAATLLLNGMDPEGEVPAIEGEDWVPGNLLTDQESTPRRHGWDEARRVVDSCQRQVMRLESGT